MKKPLPYLLFFKSFIPALVFALFSHAATGQDCQSVICPSAYLTNFDGAPRAFKTNGNANRLTDWETAGIWCKCGSSGNIPPSYDANDNNTYIEISAGDSVFTSKPIKFKNSFTLIVCGYLEINSLEEVDPSTVNSLNLIICEGGTLKLSVLNVWNVARIAVYGTFILEELYGFNQQTNCIFGTGLMISKDGYSPFVNQGFRYGITGTDCISTTPVDGGVVLSVELLNFSQQIKTDRVDLLWTTGTEINNDYFTLERSRDLNGWEALGHVPGAGNSSIPLSYTFSDLSPMEGVTYYRLKQTDFDGKFEYFRPIAVHYDLGMEGLEFKVIKQFSNWIIAVPNDGIYQVEVYNLMGHRLSGHKVKNNLVIPAPEGAVVIRVTDGYSRTASRVVM